MHDTVVGLDASDPLYLPEEAGAVTRIKVALRAFAVLWKDPANGVAAPVLNLSMDREVFAQLVEQYLRTEDGQALLRERPDLQAETIDLASLRELPEGTLGKALAHYYENNGIAPFASPYPVRNDVEYLAKRYREVHDMLHIVTGYGTDAVGEMELQAFVLGNIGLRTCALILAVASLAPTIAPVIWRSADKLRAAYRRGRRSRDVSLKPRYERYWRAGLEEVRAELGLVSPQATSV